MLTDDKKTAKIGAPLKAALNGGSRLSIVSGLFSIYAFDALKKDLSRTRSARLLFTQLGFHDKTIDTNIESQLNGDRFELRLRNQLNQAKVAAECAQWIEKQAQVKDDGFKVFKLNATNINPWDADFETLEDELALSVDSIKSDRTAEDALYEVLLKYGLDLTLPIEQHEIDGKTIYGVDMGALMVCLDDAISIEAVEGIGKRKEERQPEVMRVVFKDAGFADDVVKINTVQVLKQFGIDDVRSI
jgi:adenine-specific DNA-methyltransferase